MYVYIFSLIRLYLCTHRFKIFLKKRTHVIYLNPQKTKIIESQRETNMWINYDDIMLIYFYFTVVRIWNCAIRRNRLYLLFANKHKKVTGYTSCAWSPHYTVQYRIKWIFALDDKKSKIGQCHENTNYCIHIFDILSDKCVKCHVGRNLVRYHDVRG